MSSGGSGGASTIITHGLPDYDGMDTKIEAYLNQANTLSNEAFVDYNGVGDSYPQDQDSTGTALSPMPHFTSVRETVGIGAMATRASNGDSNITIGRTRVAEDIDGTVLNADVSFGGTTVKDNYYTKETDKIIQQLQEKTKPEIDQSANIMGRFGGNAHQTLLYKAGEDATNSILDIADKTYYDDYKRSRKYQHGAIERATEYSNETIRDFEQLRKAGIYVREYEQGKMTNAFKKYIHTNELQVKRLHILGNALRAITGSVTETVESSPLPDTFSQVAGLALTAYAGYSSITSANTASAIQDEKLKRLKSQNASIPTTQTNASGGSN